MKSKVESVFNKAAVLVLEEGEYENKMTHAKYEELKSCIATCLKSFYLLGIKGFDVEECKEFLTMLGDENSIDEMLEKAQDDKVTES